MAKAASVRREEIARFDALGDAWWDPPGRWRRCIGSRPFVWPGRVISPSGISDVGSARRRRSRDSNGSTSAAGQGSSPSPWRGSGADVTGIDPAEVRSRSRAATPRKRALKSAIASRRSR